MNKFAFIRKDKNNQPINSWLGKYVKTNGAMDLIKIGGLLICLFFIIFTYLYFINRASTNWYFLREANNKNEKVVANLDILKFELLNYKQENWDKIHTTRYQNKSIKVSTEIVKIPSNSEFVSTIKPR